MGLDVFYYKMKVRKSESQVEKEIEDIKKFYEDNLEKESDGNIKKYGYGRKIWDALYNFSRNNNIERCWDLLDKYHIMEMRDLSFEESICDEEFKHGKYEQQYKMFCDILNEMNDNDQIFVIYSYRTIRLRAWRPSDYMRNTFSVLSTISMKLISSSSTISIVIVEELDMKL